MPTVFTVGGFKFQIYAGDHNPPHVHVRGRGKTAVIELKTLVVLHNHGFKGDDLRDILEQVAINTEFLVEAWEDFNDD